MQKIKGKFWWLLGGAVAAAIIGIGVIGYYELGLHVRNNQYKLLKIKGLIKDLQVSLSFSNTHDKQITRLKYSKAVEGKYNSYGTIKIPNETEAYYLTGIIDDFSEKWIDVDTGRTIFRIHKSDNMTCFNDFTGGQEQNCTDLPIDKNSLVVAKISINPNGDLFYNYLRIGAVFKKKQILE